MSHETTNTTTTPEPPEPTEMESAFSNECQKLGISAGRHGPGTVSMMKTMFSLGYDHGKRSPQEQPIDTSDPITELYANLIYPRDKNQIHKLGRMYQTAELNLCRKTNLLSDILRAAKQSGVTSTDAFNSIIAWYPFFKGCPEALADRVIHSIKESARSNHRNKHKFYWIHGKQGSGKSTLAKLIADQHAAITGENAVIVEEFNESAPPRNMPNAQRTSIIITSQNPPTNPEIHQQYTIVHVTAPGGKPKPQIGDIPPPSMRAF